MKKYLAEMIGTMVLVLMGCGGAVMLGGCGSVPQIIGVALCFGLAVMAMCYAIGGVSGCHINPAITLGVWLSGRMSGKDAGYYMLFQVIGAFIGSFILFLLTSTMPDIASATATGANAVGDNATVAGTFIAELVFTCIFVLVVLGSTHGKLGGGNCAGIAIGLTLTLIHIVCIPIDGTSVNPARSIAPAVFQGGQTISDLWIFIIAPLLGGALAAGLWRIIDISKKEA
jgi:aquaporin Z